MLNKYIAGLGVLALVVTLAACDTAPEAEVQDFSDDTIVIDEPMDDFSDDDFLLVDEDELMEVEVVEEEEDMDAEL